MFKILCVVWLLSLFLIPVKVDDELEPEIQPKHYDVLLFSNTYSPNPEPSNRFKGILQIDFNVIGIVDEIKINISPDVLLTSLKLIHVRIDKNVKPSRRQTVIEGTDGVIPSTTPDSYLFKNIRLNSNFTYILIISFESHFEKFNNDHHIFRIPFLDPNNPVQLSISHFDLSEYSFYLSLASHGGLSRFKFRNFQSKQTLPPTHFGALSYALYDILQAPEGPRDSWDHLFKFFAHEILRQLKLHLEAPGNVVSIIIPAENRSYYELEVPLTKQFRFWFTHDERVQLSIAKKIISFVLSHGTGTTANHKKPLENYLFYEVVKEITKGNSLEYARFEMLLDLMRRDILHKLDANSFNEKGGFIYEMFHETMQYDSFIALDETSQWLQQDGYPLVSISLDADDVVVFNVEQFGKPVNVEDWLVPICDVSSIEHCNGMEINKELTFVLQNQVDEWKWIFVRKPTSYYRLTFDDTIWGSIISKLRHQHTDIPAEYRARILDDAMNLALVGRTYYDLVWELLEYMEHETDFRPWVAVHENMKILHSLLNNTDVEPAFLVYMTDLTRPLEVLTESPMSMYEVQMYDVYQYWQSMYGTLEPKSFARPSSNQDVYKQHRVDEKIAEINCCLRMRLAETQQLYQNILRKLKNFKHDEHFIRNLQCASCVTNRTALKNLFRHSIYDNVFSSQDKAVLRDMLLENGGFTAQSLMLKYIRKYSDRNIEVEEIVPLVKKLQTLVYNPALMAEYHTNVMKLAAVDALDDDEFADIMNFETVKKTWQREAVDAVRDLFFNQYYEEP